MGGRHLGAELPGSRRTDLPLLGQAAVAHAQFETIHPYIDGNGRSGRALVHVMLRNAGATTRTTVPVSAGLLSDTDAYFEALTAYRAGDPNPVIERFSRAAFAAVHNGRQSVPVGTLSSGACCRSCSGSHR